MSTCRRDEAFMDQALALAERGRGRTSPNPMVGAVLVAPDGSVVGTGYHARAGEPHAEVRALDEAGVRARSATLYCTLEPCGHHGRTGPCTHRIADAGVRRVVVGLVDPNPRVDGAGLAYLRSRGIRVDAGVRRRAAARQNEVFVTWMTRSRPFVIMKIAVSRDGKIAARPGVRTVLTGDAAMAVAHRLRAEVDAVGVGSSTVLVDDPQLTVRLTPQWRPLARVILDRRLRTPPAARVFRTLADGPILIVTTAEVLSRESGRAEALRAAGAELLPGGELGIAAILRQLAAREITSILVEGGAKVHQAIWEARVVDRVQCYTAPVELGAEGVPWLVASVMDRLQDVRTCRYGRDVLRDGYVHRVD